MPQRSIYNTFQKSLPKATFFFDFDSTIYPNETLDEVLSLAISGRKDAKSLKKSIERICILGMDGKISISESIKQRIFFATITKQTISDYITNNLGLQPAVEIGLNSLIKNGHDVFIVSNGFTDWILPMCKNLTIEENKIIANHFSYNSKGEAFLLKKNMPVTRGKRQLIAKLKKKEGLKNPIIMVGDSVTDADAKSNEAADYFVAFTAYIKRKGIEKVADRVISDVKNFEGQLTDFLKDTI